MPTITDVKKDRQFYQDFSSLIEVMKVISASQFHALEKRIRTFPQLTELLEEILGGLDLDPLHHPMVKPKDLPTAVVVITSDAGLLGGLNFRLVATAFPYVMQERRNQLIVVGAQGQKFTQGQDFTLKFFPGIDDEKSRDQAMALRDYLLTEVAARRIGAVKIVFPFAESISHQQILERDLLPCTEWAAAQLPSYKNIKPLEKTKIEATSEILLESSPGAMIEYLASLWMGQKLFEIFQFSRLAEQAARVIHLEESSQKIKELEKKLRVKYFRIYHEIIDQQMRELFTARSLYA